MSVDNGYDGTVRYSVKELLGRIDLKVDALILRIDLKADAATVEALDKRMDRLERRVGAWAAVLAFLAAVGVFVVPVVVHFF